MSAAFVPLKTSPSPSAEPSSTSISSPRGPGESPLPYQSGSLPLPVDLPDAVVDLLDRLRQARIRSCIKNLALTFLFSFTLILALAVAGSNKSGRACNVSEMQEDFSHTCNPQKQSLLNSSVSTTASCFVLFFTILALELRKFTQLGELRSRCRGNGYLYWVLTGDEWKQYVEYYFGEEAKITQTVQGRCPNNWFCCRRRKFNRMFQRDRGVILVTPAAVIIDEFVETYFGAPSSSGSSCNPDHRFISCEAQMLPEREQLESVDPSTTRDVELGTIPLTSNVDIVRPNSGGQYYLRFWIQQKDMRPGVLGLFCCGVCGFLCFLGLMCPKLAYLDVWVPHQFSNSDMQHIQNTLQQAIAIAPRDVVLTPTQLLLNQAMSNQFS